LAGKHRYAHSAPQVVARWSLALLWFRRQDRIKAREPTAGQIDDDAHIRRASAVDNLPEQCRLMAAFADFRVARMDMNDRGPGTCGFDARLGNLFGRYRETGMARIERAAASDRTGQKDRTAVCWGRH
jgi:hypothetical protein